MPSCTPAQSAEARFSQVHHERHWPVIYCKLITNIRNVLCTEVFDLLLVSLNLESIT